LTEDAIGEKFAVDNERAKDGKDNLFSGQSKPSKFSLSRNESKKMRKENKINRKLIKGSEFNSKR